MKQYVAVGLTVLAGAAILEAALVPGLLIGGAAMLAPKALPALRRGLRPLTQAATRRRAEPETAQPARPDSKAPLSLPQSLGIGRAVAKTITFRIIATTLDFTSNYVVIGELTTAAGLSTFNLVAGPVFYLVHETAWNHFGPPPGDAVTVSRPGLRPNGGAAPSGERGFTMSRALAKTITFRTFATVMDFTTNYVVVRDVVTAAGLSAFGFFVGPFVYLGHEKLWDHYYPAEQEPASAAPLKHLPAPA